MLVRLFMPSCLASLFTNPLLATLFSIDSEWSRSVLARAGKAVQEDLASLHSGLDLRAVISDTQSLLTRELHVISLALRRVELLNATISELEGRLANTPMVKLPKSSVSKPST